MEEENKVEEVVVEETPAVKEAPIEAPTAEMVEEQPVEVPVEPEPASA